MIINYCGFSYLPHSGTFSALVDSRNENFYHISCLQSLMDLSHINLHGIHKILSHQHFFFLNFYAHWNRKQSQACSKAKMSRYRDIKGTMRCGENRLRKDHEVDIS